MPECYIRGSTIKYLRIPDEVIDMVKEETVVKNKVRNDIKGGRGGQNQRNRPAARGKFIVLLSVYTYWLTHLLIYQKIIIAFSDNVILILCLGNFGGRAGGKGGGQGGGRNPGFPKQKPKQ